MMVTSLNKNSSEFPVCMFRDFLMGLMRSQHFYARLHAASERRNHIEHWCYRHNSDKNGTFNSTSRCLCRETIYILQLNICTIYSGFSRLLILPLNFVFPSPPRPPPFCHKKRLKCETTCVTVEWFGGWWGGVRGFLTSMPLRASTSYGTRNFTANSTIRHVVPFSRTAKMALSGLVDRPERFSPSCSACTAGSATAPARNSTAVHS